MNQSEIKEHMAVARELVEEAGKISLEYFRKPHAVDNKMEGGIFYDPVTQADKRIEEKLREGLSEKFPGYAILGEEYGSEGDSNLRWVIDPIDGTRAFISGVTGWGVLLGLTDGDQCLGGIMHQPYTQETFVGDGEAWLYSRDGKQQLQSRQDATLSDAIIYSTHPYLFSNKEEHEGFKEISARCRLQRFGGDCYSYCLLAHGCIDLVVEGLLQSYDIVPLIPIIKAAGGIITNLDGEIPMEGGTIIAAANESLHADAMELMQKALNA